QIENASKEFKNPILHSFIRWKYGKEIELLERKSIGEIYPVAVIRPEEYSVQIKDLDSVLKENPKLEIIKDKKYITTDTSYRTLILKILGKKLENKYTYTMKKINIGKKITLECELGKYFEGLDTNYSLEWEIFNKANNLRHQGENSFKKFNEQLSLRNKLHEVVNNPILDGFGRSAMIGISTLIICKIKGKYYMFLRRRSKKSVSVDQGLLHVIPSSTFQPMTVFHKEEFKVSHNIYREYLEELFNRPEPEPNEYWNTIYNDEILKYLKELLDNGQAKLLFSGLAINLFSLRPEICTVLIIDSEKWIEYHTESGDNKKFFKFNEEWENESGDYTFLIGQIEYREDDKDLKPKISAFDIAPQVKKLIIRVKITKNVFGNLLNQFF
ncbi:MAG: hypothetical protein NTU73_05290, partial [Ignavibacteriae bacterium]|nr:hypothetical protein [Ignavibacteriota bacterium]